jgi:hypothetical protein
MRNELNPNVDKAKLKVLLDRFRSLTRRGIDRSLADEIQAQFIDSENWGITLSTEKKLARWCKTNGNPYQDAMPVAQQISELLYGRILDRNLLNT